MRRCLAALAAPPVLLAVLLAPAPATAGTATVVGPGVSYRELQRGDSRAFVATVRLSAASTPSAVLAGGRLAGFETTSSMAARSGAVLAVNGDFGLASGRPVHAFASGGVLAQTAQLPGRGLGTARSGDDTRAGFPTVGVRVVSGSRRVGVARWNAGAPTGGQVAGYTAAGAGLETPPADACYAVLVARTGPVLAAGRAERAVTVRNRVCQARPPAVPADGALLAARRGTAGAAALSGLAEGSGATLSQALGWPGTWSLVGASEGLVVDGRVNAVDVDQPGAYVQDPAPRTAVGTTGDGRLLLVVVDGRQPGHSTGMSLRQLARLMVDLGARSAVNLDGGGSSTMWVRGAVVNRPSDGRERAVDSALVVLPGAAPATSSGPASTPEQDDAAWQAAAHDAASTGGLAEALARRGTPLAPAVLTRQG